MQVHCDIKPANILVRSLVREKGKERYAKLADFGITRQKGCPMGD